MHKNVAAENVITVSDCPSAAILLTTSASELKLLVHQLLESDGVGSASELKLPVHQLLESDGVGSDNTYIML